MDGGQKSGARSIPRGHIELWPRNPAIKDFDRDHHCGVLGGMHHSTSGICGMALEVAILNDEGRPRMTVYLSIAVHETLMREVEKQECRMLPRIHDYYTETRFAVPELADLESDLRSVLCI